MRRTGSPEPEPDAEPTLLERLQDALGGLLTRRGGPPRQALPMSSYRGQVGQPMSYRERRARPGLGRDGQHSAYALIFVVVLLVLVVGLAWALGGFGGGGGSSQPTPRPTPLIVAAPTATAPLLPTPPPGTGLPSPVAQPINSPSPTSATGARRTYVVRAGDTPNSIAQQFGITAAELMQANGISDPRALRIGQELAIPNR
jgi:hypothetical protein